MKSWGKLYLEKYKIYLQNKFYKDKAAKFNSPRFRDKFFLKIARNHSKSRLD